MVITKKQRKLTEFWMKNLVEPDVFTHSPTHPHPPSTTSSSSTTYSNSLTNTSDSHSSSSTHITNTDYTHHHVPHLHTSSSSSLPTPNLTGKRRHSTSLLGTSRQPASLQPHIITPLALELDSDAVHQDKRPHPFRELTEPTPMPSRKRSCSDDLTTEVDDHHQQLPLFHMGPQPAAQMTVKQTQDNANLLTLPVAKLTKLLKSDPISSVYPLPNRALNLWRNMKLKIQQSNIPDAGRGVFATSNIRKGTILGVYSGKVTNVITPYSLEMASRIRPLGRKNGIFFVDGTPTGSCDNTIFALINEHIWMDLEGDRLIEPNVRIAEMGIIITLSNIKANSELLTDYSDSYNWDHLKITLLPNLLTQIHTAQLKLCDGMFSSVITNIQQQTANWTVHNLNHNRTLEPLKTIINMLEFDIATSQLHNHPPRLRWSEGLHTPLISWLQELTNYIGFVDVTHFRRYKIPNSPIPNLSDTITLDLQMAPLRNPLTLWNANTILHVSANQDTHSTISIHLTNCNSDREHYNLLRVVVDTSTDITSLYQNLHSLDIPIFSWNRPFDLYYYGETIGKGYCGWLAMEQNSRRSDWIIPPCLKLEIPKDRSKLTEFLTDIRTRADPICHQRLDGVIHRLLTEKHAHLDSEYWVNTDVQLGLFHSTNTCWWNILDGQYVMVSPNANRHNWPDITRRATANEHIGFVDPHFFLTTWIENEIDDLNKNLFHLCSQIWNHFKSPNWPHHLQAQTPSLPAIDLTYDNDLQNTPTDHSSSSLEDTPSLFDLTPNIDTDTPTGNSSSSLEDTFKFLDPPLINDTSPHADTSTIDTSGSHHGESKYFSPTSTHTTTGNPGPDQSHLLPTPLPAPQPSQMPNPTYITTYFHPITQPCHTTTTPSLPSPNSPPTSSPTDINVCPATNPLTSTDFPQVKGEDAWRMSKSSDNLDIQLLHTPPPCGQLRYMVYNINTLTLEKLTTMLFYFRTLHLDVLTLIDTRFSSKSYDFISGACKWDMANYPLGLMTHTVHTKISILGRNCVGGQLWIYNNRFSAIRFQEIAVYGICTEFQALFGQRQIRIQSVYWPCKPSQISDGESLWNITRLAYNTNEPIQHIKTLMGTRIGQITRSNIPLIIGGDFNTDIWKKDTLNLMQFMDEWDLHISNTDKDKSPSYTRNGHASRIDHVIYKGNATILDCRPLDLLENIDDHLPLYTNIGLSGANAQRKKKAKHMIRSIPDRKNPKTMDSVNKFVEMFDFEQDLPPEAILDSLCDGTAAAASASYSTKSKRKDGWSPHSQALFINIRILILIQRHTDGINRDDCAQWSNSNYQKGLKLLLKRWKSMIATVAKDPAERKLLRDAGNYGYNFWVHATWKKIKDAKNAYIAVRKDLQGRKRRDRRLIRGERTTRIEKFREARQIGHAIKSLNPNKTPTFHMTELRLGDQLVTDPNDIAQAVLKNFILWFKATINPLAGTLSNPNAHWSLAETSLDEFVASNNHTNIPSDLLTTLHKHLQRKNMDSTALSTFQAEVLLPPTLTEFCNGIDHSPDHSAAGPTGLNYDCIKLWPMETRANALKILNTLWVNKIVPKSWKWRWLVPIPKKDDPQLSDLRPLVLIEAIRKIWTGIFIHRILTFLHNNNTLCQNQHGFMWGKSTESASIILLNALETACEWRSRLYISSWDLKRAFDSVPSSMLIWSLIRIGVPAALAEYLVQMDLDGYVVVRSPLTMEIHEKEGTEGLRRRNLFLTPNKGTGQGDKTSPLLWDAFCDILLCALAEVEEGPFFFQDHCGKNHVTPDVAYADDVISMQGNTLALQRKADIISAFTIIMNMAISIEKLRLFGIIWGNHHRLADEHITIHQLNWTPVNIPIQHTGDLKHLGIIWGMDLLNHTQLSSAAELLTTWCKFASYSRLSIASKKIALEASIYQKVIYFARFASWDVKQLKSLDSIVAAFIKKTHKTAVNLPLDLVFLPKNLGGLGYKKLSHEIQKAQFALLWRLLASHGCSKYATLSCIARGFKAAGQLSPHCLNSDMTASLGERWWIHGVQDYLNLLDLKLHRNGPTPCQADEWPGTVLQDTQKAELSRLGIATYGELYMAGDTIDLPSILGIPNITPCPWQPITLRTGQVWRLNNHIWEILATNPDHLQIIYWQPHPQDPNLLFLDEENFCSGSGSKHTLHRNELMNIYFATILTLDVESHRSNGHTVSKILFERLRHFCWPTHYTPSPVDELREALSLSETPLPTKARDIYTDGSWSLWGSAASRLLQNGNIRARGAVVLEDISDWAPVSYYGIKIVGSIGRAKSAYIYELLSITLASLVVQLTEVTGPIRSDCLSAIKTVSKCWWSRHLYRSYPLIGAAIRTLHPHRIAHVRAHPERKKIDKEWTDQDCGIYVADQIAGGKPTLTIKAGILDSTLLDIITLPLPYTYRDLDDSYVIEDLHDRYHRLAAQRYLTRRDIYRTSDPINPRPAKWAGMNLTQMAHMTGTKKLNLSEGSSATQNLFDWNCIGSNRIKGNPIANSLCHLCGKFEDRPHILLHCKHPEILRLRTSLMDEAREDIALLTAGPSQNIAWAIFKYLEDPTTGHQIMLGQLEPPLRELILHDAELTTLLTTADWNPVDKILCKIGSAALLILKQHMKLTYWHLTGRLPSGLVRTSMGFQKSINAFYKPVPTVPLMNPLPLPPLPNPMLTTDPEVTDLPSSPSENNFLAPSYNDTNSISTLNPTSSAIPDTSDTSNPSAIAAPSDTDPVMEMIKLNRLVPPNEIFTDDEPPVRRKRNSLNTIYDGTETYIIRGKGTWKPYLPHLAPLARLNRKFMKSIKRKPDG